MTFGEDDRKAPGELSEGEREPGVPGIGQPTDHAVAADLLVHALSAHLPQEMGRRSQAGAPSALRVLIADDYADAAQSLAMLLSNGGARTEIAMDGEQALARANSWRPHVCVLDIGMPGINGFELARRIREQRWAERPLLIALSGWTTAEHRRIALAAGFDHFLRKPAEALKLARIIQAHFSGAATDSALDSEGPGHDFDR